MDNHAERPAGPHANGRRDIEIALDDPVAGAGAPGLGGFAQCADKFALVASMAPAVLAGETPQLVLFRLLPGMEVAFRADAFGLLFALGASLLWIAASFYSIGYMRTLEEHSQTRYFTCFALALSATMGVAFAANLFTLFLFYEGLTLATYPLVAHKETVEARAGARSISIRVWLSGPNGGWAAKYSWSASISFR